MALRLCRNILHNSHGFFIFCLVLIQCNRYTLFIIRPKCLILTPLIVMDHTVGSIQNRLGRTIILLQLDHLCIRKCFFKIKNVVDIRTSELVNRLIIITDHTEISVLCRQQTDKLELNRVRILILIHHNVLKTILVIIQYFRIGFEKFNSFEKQIVKIQRIIAP